MKKAVVTGLVLFVLLSLQGCTVYPSYGFRTGAVYRYPAYGYGYNNQPFGFRPYGYGWGRGYGGGYGYGGGFRHGWHGGGWGGNGWGGHHGWGGGFHY